MITTVCKISYGSQTVPPIVPAVQGDTGRAISFEIADFTPPAGATATYFILKPSGEAIYNSATITDNSILCELTAQSLAEAGENRMQVRVLLGDDIVTSFEVILMVRTFLGDDAMESGTEMNIFDQAVEQATEQFQENAEQIVEEVIESIPADYTELTEEVDELNERIDNITPGLSGDAKEALLACLRGIAWLDWDTSGQSLYNALESALYPNAYPKIVATYNPGSHVVYDTDSLNTLKNYLTVVYYETEESAGETLGSNDYTLVGTLEAGTSVITVIYNEYETKINVTVATHTIYAVPANTVFDGTAASDIVADIGLYENDISYSIIIRGSINITGTATARVFMTRISGSNTILASLAKVESALTYYNVVNAFQYDNHSAFAEGVYPFAFAFSHVAGSDLCNMRIKFNGQLATVDNKTYTYTQSSDPFVIGCGYDYRETGMAKYNRFTGTLQELKVLDYAMSSSELDQYING